MRQISDGVHVAEKAPGENLDYGFDWINWLQSGETITSSSWTGDTSLTLTNQALIGSKGSVYIAGGTLGTVPIVTNTIITNSSPPRTAVRVINLTIKVR